MTTTHEQLQAWRAQFEADLPEHKTRKFESGTYNLNYIADMWAGYLRAKQETEQAMKLAKFGAMVAKSHASGDFIEAEDLTAALLASGCAEEHIKGKIDYAPNIEATIKELLND